MREPATRAKKGGRRLLAAQLVHLQTYQRAVDVLAAAKIPVIALKGAAFVDTLYALGERPMSDIDLLIPQARRAAADSVLQRAGFEKKPPPPSRRHSHATHYNWGYERDGVLVEVHVDLAQPGRYRIDFDGVWNRARLYKTEARSVRTLCPEDTLLYLAIHQAKHWLEIGPNDLEDLRRILARWRPDWNTTLKRAVAWRARATLFSTLGRASAAGIAVPENVLASLAPRRWRRTVLRLLSRRPDPRSPAFLQRGYQLATVLATTDRAMDGAGFLARYATRRLADRVYPS